MTTVYLALGSNVGDSQKNLDNSILALQKHLSNIEQAPRYHSKAVGFTDQPDFLNTAVRAGTMLTPGELLAFIKQVEKDSGRVESFHWGPRELDIDIIFYGDQVVNKPNLQIPHTEFANRDFVLQPLCDLDPDLVDPVSKRTVRDLLEQLPPATRSIIGR